MTNRYAAAKIGNFSLNAFRRYRECVDFCIVIINGFLMTQRQMTVKDIVSI